MALTAAPEAEKLMENLPHFAVYIGKDGQIEKYKCRLVTQGCRQVKGLHYHESFSPTPAASSMRAVLATVVVKN